MARINFSQFRFVVILAFFSSLLVGCTSSASNRYWGKTVAPGDNVLRYISGSEPESLDPAFGTGQPEARIYMALYDGLLEYHPKTMEPIPAIAESWEINKDGTEYLFHLRHNAKFSNGDPITAKDFVYTFRRSLSPELASRNANLGYYIKYAEAYNSGDNFVKDANGQFLLKKDFAKEGEPIQSETVAGGNIGAETEFSKFISSPERLSLDSDSLKLAQAIEAENKIKEVFKLKAADLKNASTLANKIKADESALAKFLRENLPPESLACTDQNSCSDSAKQNLADSLNKLIDADSLFTKNWFPQVTLSNDAKKLAEKIEKENKKRDESNKKIDEEIAQETDTAKKEEKAKTKKKPIGKLFYANRFLLEQSFPEEIEKSSLVPVKAEDLGVEAVDDYTLRVKLYQPAPYFVQLIPHQLFRVVHQASIEKFGKEWQRVGNIVTSGAFKLSVHRPYDTLIVVKDPNNWDAANVHLDGIEFYPLEEGTTMMNLYKAGSVDAVYNHIVPPAWLDEIRPYASEYQNLPEVANEYYSISVKKPPMDNLKVRQALSLAIDRNALAQFRKTPKPLSNFTPDGIFPKYDEARKKVFGEKLKSENITYEEWSKQRIFDAEKARKLMTEAGYPVQKAGNGWSCPTFPADKVTLNYNTAESNKAIAEFNQAQWKQNLGITIPLKNMEWKTFLPFRSGVQYQGVARNAWVGDYMDPFTFLNLFYSPQNDGATGFWDPKYDALLDAANKELDSQKRLEMLATAEYQILHEQLVIPLVTQATNWIKKPYVKGMYANPGTLHAWKFVYIEHDPNKWDTDAEKDMKNSDAQVDDQINRLRATQKSANTAE